MRLLFAFALIILSVSNVHADKQYLYQWNDGSGTTWPGWTYQADVRYGHPGFTRNISTLYSGQTYPEMFEVGGYGDDNLAVIDSDVRAPSTTQGGSFKVYDTGLGTTNDVSWWMWYGLTQLSNDPGVTNSATNRLDFYLKAQGVIDPTETGDKDSISTRNFHIGTYLCWDGGGIDAQNCPEEAAGQHWYHELVIKDDAWVHVSLDRHPTHKRGACSTDVTGCVAGDNPSFIESGKNYYENMNSVYFEVRYDQPELVTMWVDEVGFDTAANENEQSVTSLWVGYWPSDDYWRISWQDMSFQTASGFGLIEGNTFSTFEIRYSTAPITNANWDAATPISAELFSGTEYTGSIDLSKVRRTGSGLTTVYTKFKLPDNVESSNDVIYFAIKDVSVSGGHAGTKYAWNRLDGHNAPTSNVRTINYNLRSGGGASINGKKYRVRAE